MNPTPTRTQAAAKAELEFTAVPFCIVFGADGGVRYKGDPSKIDFATVFDAPAASEEAVMAACARRGRAARPVARRTGPVDAAVARPVGASTPQPHRPASRPGGPSPPPAPTTTATTTTAAAAATETPVLGSGRRKDRPY